MAVHSSYLIKVEGRQWNGVLLITGFRILWATYKCFVTPVFIWGQRRGPLFSLIKQRQKTVFRFQTRAVFPVWWSCLWCQRTGQMKWEDSLKSFFIMILFIRPWDGVQQVHVEQIMLVIYSYVNISVSAALWELVLVANPTESAQIITKFSHSLYMHTYILHTHKLIHMYGLTKVILFLKNLFFSRGSAQLVLRLHVHLI